jgi:hypothetical protein
MHESMEIVRMIYKVHQAQNRRPSRVFVPQWNLKRLFLWLFDFRQLMVLPVRLRSVILYQLSINQNAHQCHLNWKSANCPYRGG